MVDMTAPISLTKEAIDPKQLHTELSSSVRQFFPGVYGGVIGGDALGFMYIPQDLLPPWGTFACDRALRLLDNIQFNALWSGARNVYIDKILSTPSEISGGRNQTYRWQDIFYFTSEFGEGYDFMMTKVLIDYLTLNRGAFIEKVGYGNSDTPLDSDARVVGLNHLDALRIVMTGNREWPYIYYSEYTGEYHRLHYTRVMRLVHKPSPITTMAGVGKSVLYDALSVSNAQVLLGKAQNESLSDSPPSGIVVFNNIRGEDVNTAMLQFAHENRRDGMTTYRAPLHLESKDPTAPATVEFIPLAVMPKDYDYEKYMKTHVNLLALTMGLDPQDIWPLSTHSLGSGAQSTILEQKTRGKGPGYVLTLLERMWNTVLPRSLKFEYKAANSQQGLEEAQIAFQWSQTLNPILWMTDDEKRQIMSNQVEAFADALLDEDGTLIRLPDSDPKDQQAQQVEDVIADESNGAGDTTTTSASTETTADDNEQMGQNATASAPTTKEFTPDDNWETDGVVYWRKKQDNTPAKPYDKRAKQLTLAMAGIMQDALKGVAQKATTKAQLKATLLQHGQDQYADVLDENDIGELDDSDKEVIADWLKSQSPYVNGLSDDLYGDSADSINVDDRAGKWAGAIASIYYLAQQNAEENALYKFVGDDGKESCTTCQMLKDEEPHRMAWWVGNDYLPNVSHDNFECGTWAGHCEHYLERQ